MDQFVVQQFRGGRERRPLAGDELVGFASRRQGQWQDARHLPVREELRDFDRHQSHEGRIGLQQRERRKSGGRLEQVLREPDPRNSPSSKSRIGMFALRKAQRRGNRWRISASAARQTAALQAPPAKHCRQQVVSISCNALLAPGCVNATCCAAFRSEPCSPSATRSRSCFRWSLEIIE